MVIIPLRALVLVLGETVYAVVPLPVPLPPDTTLIQVTDGSAVHVHPAVADTAIVSECPWAPTETLPGLMVKVQVRPDCVTRNVRPPMLTEPDRVEVLPLDVMLKVTWPGPVPLAPERTVIQGTALTAVHEHPDGVVTVTEACAASAPAARLEGLMLIVHVVPCCVTVSVWPAIVTVPVRGEVEVDDAIDRVTSPLPVPDAPPLTVIHGAELTAVQEQPLPAVTVTVPVDATAETMKLVVESVYEHAGAA
jgi:hypothetical protein